MAHWTSRALGIINRSWMRACKLGCGSWLGLDPISMPRYVPTPGLFLFCLNQYFVPMTQYVRICVWLTLHFDLSRSPSCASLRYGDHRPLEEESQVGSSLPTPEPERLIRNSKPLGSPIGRPWESFARRISGVKEGRSSWYRSRTVSSTFEFKARVLSWVRYSWRVHVKI
jgi:hypothetical protein